MEKDKVSEKDQPFDDIMSIFSRAEVLQQDVNKAIRYEKMLRQ